MKNIDNRLKNIFAILFNLSAEKIEKNFSQENTRNWDSLKHMNFIVAIEEEFKIEFDDDEAFEMTSYEKIISVIKEKY